MDERGASMIHAHLGIENPREWFAMKPFAIFAFAFLAIFFCGCVTKDDIVRLDERLTTLERRMDRRDAEVEKTLDDVDKRVTALQETLRGDGQALRDQSAGLYATLEEIQNSLRSMQGGYEEADYRLKQEVRGIQSSNRDARQEMEAASDLRERRIARLEQYLNLESAKPEEAPPPSPETPTLSDRIDAAVDGEELYTLAKQAFDAGDYEAGRRGFQKLLSDHPGSKNADNAQFWIGETYYKEKWWQKAILEYQKVIENYPKGNKVRAALLKQGFSFYNIGGNDNKANSRLILKELARKYPKSNEAKIAKRKLKEF